MNPLSSPAFRLKFYKELLKDVCEDHITWFGYCYYLDTTFLHLKGYFGSFKMSDLPELNYYKPKKFVDKAYWFPRTAKGWEKRIAILVEIIANMEEHLNHYARLTRLKTVKVVQSPITERYCRVGDEATLDLWGNKIRCGGAWFDFVGGWIVKDVTIKK